MPNTKTTATATLTLARVEIAGESATIASPANEKKQKKEKKEKDLISGMSLLL